MIVLVSNLQPLMFTYHPVDVTSHLVIVVVVVVVVVVVSVIIMQHKLLIIIFDYFMFRIKVVKPYCWLRIVTKLYFSSVFYCLKAG